MRNNETLLTQYFKQSFHAVGFFISIFFIIILDGLEQVSLKQCMVDIVMVGIFILWLDVLFFIMRKDEKDE